MYWVHPIPKWYFCCLCVNWLGLSTHCVLLPTSELNWPRQEETDHKYSSNQTVNPFEVTVCWQPLHMESLSTLRLVHYALLLPPACWKSNNTNARLMAFAPSLALDPTFGIHSHKTLDTAQPCHRLKPNWKPSSSHSISILININTSFCYSHSVCVCVCVCLSVCVCVCLCVCVCMCVCALRARTHARINWWLIGFVSQTKRLKFRM